MLKTWMMFALVVALAASASIRAETMEEKLKKAYDADYKAGYQDGLREGGGTESDRVKLSGIVGGIPSGQIVFGGTEYDFNAWIDPETSSPMQMYGYEFSPWMLHNQVLKSPDILTAGSTIDEVSDAILSGKDVRIEGFAFDGMSIEPGWGKLSFGLGQDGQTRYGSIGGVGSKSWQVHGKSVPNDVVRSIDALRKLGLSHGVMIDGLMVE